MCCYGYTSNQVIKDQYQQKVKESIKDFDEDKDVESSSSIMEEALLSGFGQTCGWTKGNRKKKESTIDGRVIMLKVL